MRCRPRGWRCPLIACTGVPSRAPGARLNGGLYDGKCQSGRASWRSVGPGAIGPLLHECSNLDASCLRLAVSCWTCSTWLEAGFPSPRNDPGAPMRSTDTTRNSYRIAKRMFDIGLTTPAAILLAPIAFIIALVIKITDRGPVLYRAQRIGQGGSEFTMLKFRTHGPKRSECWWILDG